MIPDNVEKIIMTKEDYDRNVEQLLLEKTKAEQEIERLKNINEEHRILNGELRKELQQKENIIKEVRKYIEENTNSDSFTILTSGKTTDIEYCIVAFEDILEILDKE